jgi:hypothetical protein
MGKKIPQSHKGWSSGLCTTTGALVGKVLAGRGKFIQGQDDRSHLTNDLSNVLPSPIQVHS